MIPTGRGPIIAAFAAALVSCAGPGENNSGSIIASATASATGTESAGSTTAATSSTGDESGSTAAASTSDSASSGGPSSTTSTSGTTMMTTSGASADTVGCLPGSEGCICKLGDACDVGLMCDQGMCVGGLDCVADPHEPNETEQTAYDFGGINDNDGNGDNVDAVLEGTDDVDWYTFHGDDDFGYVADPTREISAMEGLRLCKFLQCDNGLGNTDVNCPGGTTFQTSPMGRPGCCGSGSFDISDYNCTGVTEDSVTVVIRVDQAASDTCVNYNLAYHF